MYAKKVDVSQSLFVFQPLTFSQVVTGASDKLKKERCRFLKAFSINYLANFVSLWLPGGVHWLVGAAVEPLWDGEGLALRGRVLVFF